jgi:hypothetical protein
MAAFLPHLTVSLGRLSVIPWGLACPSCLALAPEDGSCCLPHWSSVTDACKGCRSLGWISSTPIPPTWTCPWSLENAEPMTAVQHLSLCAKRSATTLAFTTFLNDQQRGRLNMLRSRVNWSHILPFMHALASVRLSLIHDKLA